MLGHERNRLAHMLKTWIWAAPFAALAGTSAAEGPIALHKPVACTIGTDCFIQQYADHDPGPEAADYLCRGETYDGHDGTDFRLPDKRAQAKGVAVLAVADGVVARLRDGEPDFDVGAYDRKKVPADRECGNGIVIDHPGGWQTQYCHMREGSIRVRTGDTVRAGDELGLIGQSGEAAFVHLHLTVRFQGKPVDPFAYGITACDASLGQSQSLWRETDRAQMAYRDTQAINAGFASGPITMDDIERGGIVAPDAHSPALVFYVRAIALRAGDAQRLTLLAPDGSILAESAIPPVDRGKAQYQAFAGKKLTAFAWPSGEYRGIYRVMRNGVDVVERTFVLDIP